MLHYSQITFSHCIQHMQSMHWRYSFCSFNLICIIRCMISCRYFAPLSMQLAVLWCCICLRLCSIKLDVIEWQCIMNGEGWGWKKSQLILRWHTEMYREMKETHNIHRIATLHKRYEQDAFWMTARLSLCQTKLYFMEGSMFWTVNNNE
jgi:hypothetical protein